MNRRQFNFGTVGLVAAALTEVTSNSKVYATTENQADAESSFDFYDRGSSISAEVYVSSLDGKKEYLSQLIAATNKPINVLFIFGGGALGDERASDTGGIWCPDSFADLNILRTLHEEYQDRVGFIPIACPPVFHTKGIGFADRAFLDYAASDSEYQSAKNAFVESTKAAFESGLIPTEPYLDHRFRLLMGAQQKQQLEAAYGDVPSWQGAFRAANETQSYGVPNFWLSNASAKILTQPFRGNVYHGQEVISYTVKDLATAIDTELKKAAA